MTITRTWEKEFGREFNWRQEYETMPFHFKDYSKKIFFVNPLEVIDKVKCGMHNSPSIAQILNIHKPRKESKVKNVRQPEIELEV